MRGQHRRPSEPLRERLAKLLAPAAERAKADTDEREDDDAAPRGRHAAQTHDTAA